jgi:hypothetical protein
VLSVRDDSASASIQEDEVSDRKITSHPLAWPDGWKRTASRRRAKFGDHGVNRAVREVLSELIRLGVPDYSVVISTNVETRLDGLPYANQRAPADPGVAVWFTLGKEKQRKVLACDKWDRVDHNLWAIAQHIAAIRAQERYGVGTVEQAFRGYAALPPPSSDAPSEDWRDVLEMRDDEGEKVHAFTAVEVKDAFRALALRDHPDRGGAADAFQRLIRARDEALRELEAASAERRPA